MNRRVVVTGLGAICPVGNSVSEFWNSVLEGRSGIENISSFDVSQYTSQISGEVKNFDPTEYGMDAKKVRRSDPFVHFVSAAAKEAFTDSGLDIDSEDPYKCGVLVGSGIGGLQTVENEHTKLNDKGPRRVSPFLIPAMIIDMASGEIAISYGFKGTNYGVVSACASSAHAIGDACRMIQYGDLDIAITGGAEASTSPLGLAGFCSAKALSTRNDDPKRASRPFDADRDGFVMGEGSALLVLEELEHAKKRNARIYAEIAGYGATADAYHITAPHPDGLGGVMAMRKAIEDASLNPEDIQYVNAHGTSTLLNDKIETMVIKKVFGDHAYKLAISSTKSMTGHLLGAAGAIETVACIKSICDNKVHPTINQENPDSECDLDYVPNEARDMQVDAALTNSLGFGGHNAALVIKKYSG